mmetsp:Transcript_53268/g.124851  ORF Transcript_53268/g.124851 Transcript_53268/m.124851 type:complete len:956 (-) Transcript_53268:390-3257(-)
MRVSLPIKTVGRSFVLRSTRPTAWPRRSMKSGVIGSCPTVPRMPSVPKYLRLIELFLLVNRRNCRRIDGVPNLEGVHGCSDIVHAQHLRAGIHRAQCGSEARSQTLIDRPARDLAQRSLARPADEQRVAQLSEALLPGEQAQIVLGAFRKSVARIQRDTLLIDAGLQRRLSPLLQEGGHLGQHVVVRRQAHHRVRLAAHVHQAHTRTAASHNTQGARLSQGLHIIDDICTSIQRATHHVRLAGVYRNRNSEGDGRGDHLVDPGPLGLGIDPLRPWPCRLPANVQDVCPFGHKGFAVGNGCARVVVATTVRKGIGRDIDDAHHARSSQVNAKTPGLPVHAGPQRTTGPVARQGPLRLEPGSGRRWGAVGADRWRAAAGRAAGRRLVIRCPRRPPGHDVQHLIAVDGFPLHQRFRHRLDLVPAFLKNPTGNGVLLVEDAAHLGVHLLLRVLADVGRLGHAAPEEDLPLVFGIDHRAEHIAHAVARDHVAGDTGRTLVVVGRTGRDVLQEQLLGDTPAEQDADLVEHLLVVLAVLVALRQLPGHAKGAAARHHGDLVDRIGAGQHLSHDGMAGLVVSRGALLVLGHHHALALRAHVELVLRALEVNHLDEPGIASRGEQGRFVDEVGQVGAAHARRAAGQDGRIDVLADGHLAHVHVQDLLAATDVWQRHVDLAVETAGAQQRGVQDVRAVGGRDDDDTEVGVEAVHLDEHLVQCLLALVIAAAQAGATVAADGVNFVDEDDAGRALLGLLEHVAHAGRANADEHLDEVGTRDREERHLGLAGDGLGQQRLAGTRGADHQHAARDAAAQLLELLRVLQEVDQFLHFLLGLVAAGHVGKGDGVVGLIQHPGLALAEAERPALAAALHLAHKVNPDADQQQHRRPVDQHADQEALFLARLDVEFDAVVAQIANEPAVQVGGRHAQLLAVRGFGQDFGTARTAFGQRDLLDAARLHLIEEL